MLTLRTVNYFYSKAFYSSLLFLRSNARLYISFFLIPVRSDKTLATCFTGEVLISSEMAFTTEAGTEDVSCFNEPIATTNSPLVLSGSAFKNEEASLLLIYRKIQMS